MLNDLEQEQRAWANAIRGVERFPLEDNGYEPVSMNLKNVVEFILNVMQNAEDEDAMTSAFEAQAFMGRYMKELMPYLKNVSVSTLTRRMNDLFVDPQVFPTIYTSDGKWQLVYAPRTNSTSKATNPHKYFSFKER